MMQISFLLIQMRIILIKLSLFLLLD